MRTIRQIYLEAARSIAEGEHLYSCHAVHDASNSPVWTPTYKNPDIVKYCKVFSPTGSYYEFARFLEEIHDDDEERNIRVLMLTLMAVCWRDFE